jgi:hypothetical protein
MEVRRACHAGVSIGNIKPAGVASIPICILFHGIRIRYVRALGNTISSQWAASSAHGLRCMVRRGATRGHTLEASRGTLREQTRRGTAGAHCGRTTTTWEKPTILGVTINVRRLAATTSPSTAMASASAAVASMAGIAVQLHDDMVQSVVCGTLDGRTLGHLLQLVLVSVRRSWLGQLTLVSQSRNLCCGQCRDGIVVIIIISGQNTERVLLEQLGRCITMMAGCRSSCIKATSECLLDQHLKSNPSLLGTWARVSFLKRLLVQTLVRRRRMALFLINWQSVYGLLPKMAILAQVLMQRKRTLGALATEYGPRKVTSLSSNAARVGWL